MLAVGQIVVIGAVLLSPWLFGSAEPWAYLFISLAVQAGFALWLLPQLWDRSATPVPCRALIGAGLLLALLGLQQARLPSSLVRVLNPASARFQAERADVFRTAGIEKHEGAARAPAGMTLSVSPHETRRAAYRLAAGLAVFLMIAYGRREWGQTRRIANWAAAFGVVMALFAMAQSFSGADAIYWFHQPRFGGTFFGSFTNRNHFAAHMNMVFGLLAALLLSEPEVRRLRESESWKDRLVWLTSRDGSRVLLLGFGMLVTGAAVFMSLSRGGILSLAVGTGMVAVLGRRSLERQGGLVRFLVWFSLAMAAFVIWLGVEPILVRLGTLADVARDPLHDTRARALLATLRLAAAFPAVGCGFGCFRHVFPVFQTVELGTGRWHHAHNDVAQVLAEGGVLGGVVHVLIAAALAYQVVARLRTLSRERRLFVLGLSCGLAAIAVHSLLDYSLHRPANALMLALLLGFGMAALDEVEHPQPEAGARPGGRGRLCAAAALVLLALFMRAEMVELRGSLAFARFLQWEKLVVRGADADTLAVVLTEATGEADRVLGRCRHDPSALVEITIVGLLWLRNSAIEPELRVRVAGQMERAAELAVEAAPSDYDAWLWFARALAVAGHEAQAEACLRRAQELAPAARKLTLSTRGE